jgi:2-oxoglutarate dehydrogenase E2 component (dihydrolipoamide succinyltransferase)
MALEVSIPEMGESVSEVVLLEWLKQDGEYVERDDPICLLETDKANVDLPAPAAGILRLLKEADSTLNVGETIALIEEGIKPEAEMPATETETTKKATPETEPPTPPITTPITTPVSDAFSPAVRRLLSEHDLNPAIIPTTGRNDRLLKEDVLNYIKKHDIKNRSAVPPTTPLEQASTDPPPLSAPSPESPTAPQPLPPAPTTTPAPLQSAAADAAGERRVAMTKIRQRIGEHLVAAQHNSAMLTTFNEADMSAIIALRTRYKERFAEVHGVSLGFMSFFSRATVLALGEFPEVNASIADTDIVYHDYVNLGIAVGTERGLVVPVMRHAERMSLAQTEAEIKRLAKAARDSKLKLDELSGGTFTITNGGVFGSLLSTPILNMPQSAILGMHAIKERPVAINGQVEIRPMMYLALSYDHRLIDGQQSVSFLVRLKEYLEDPARLMLEI